MIATNDSGMYKLGLVILSTATFLAVACGSSKNAATTTPSYDTLQVKYAKYMSVEPAAITNLRLYRFIDEWWGIKYVWGGTTKDGIDCSALMRQLLSDVYHVNVPRTSLQQFYTKTLRPTPILIFSRKDLLFLKKKDRIPYPMSACIAEPLVP
jgi:cell wall-associated NlpC family hydrolase